MQLNTEHKGFSFSKEGPLDMHMDPEDSLTAGEIVNRWSEQGLGVFSESMAKSRDGERRQKQLSMRGKRNRSKQL